MGRAGSAHSTAPSPSVADGRLPGCPGHKHGDDPTLSLQEQLQGWAGLWLAIVRERTSLPGPSPGHHPTRLECSSGARLLPRITSPERPPHPAARTALVSTLQWPGCPQPDRPSRRPVGWCGADRAGGPSQQKAHVRGLHLVEQLRALGNLL